LDLLEDYFAQPLELLQKDERPELGYQVGATLENTVRIQLYLKAQHFLNYG